MGILLNVMRQIESDVREKFITCGCEIVLYLYYNESAPAGTIFKTSRYSSTSFYSTLKRLAEDGIVNVQTCAEDKRSNIYTLAEAVRERLDMCMRPIHVPETNLILNHA